MADIEDIEELTLPSDDPTSAANRKSVHQVAVRSFTRRSATNHSSAPAEPQPEPIVGSGAGSRDSCTPFLPGTATVWVKTWGCGHNNSDGEYMAGMLAAQGYRIVLEDSKRGEADLWLLNSCTVKGPSEQTFVNEINRGKDSGKKVVVAGCVPQGNPSGAAWEGLSVIGVQQIDRVVEVVEETLKGGSVRLLKEKKDETSKRKAGGAKLDLPKVRKNPYIEIIPINTGCLNQCTYCKTKHARGDLGSYAPEEIVERVKTVLSEGVMEIWLTSEDTGAYGRDIGTDIVELLWGIVDAMEEHPNQTAMLRVGMTNPPYILEHLPEVAKVLSHPRVYSFLHVPVQSGSDKVLDDMRRLYTVHDFRQVCHILRERVPDVTIATDIICGFPTESEQDWQQTMDLLREYNFSVLHISQFYPRPGTPAARMTRIRTDIVKARSREATAYFNSYPNYGDKLGSIRKVLATELSADGVHFVSHDKSYAQILVPNDPRLMGRSFEVRITQVGKFYMIGQVCEGEYERLEQEDAELQKLDSSGRVAIVNKKKTPKLVRMTRKMVRLDPGRSGEDYGDEQADDSAIDGAELSLGSQSTEVPTQSEPLQDVESRRSLLRSSGSLAVLATPMGVGYWSLVSLAGLWVVFGPSSVQRQVRWSVRTVGILACAWTGWEMLLAMKRQKR
ncbi:uncharacterized protein BJ171DRAFT_90497 [Polychytrium aggregatum]|uniref:uncharacterized protein n=1 Tax=Polychytrium aggregatum TaxID=110093 RepID=UPI0022FEF7FF|nr:uncharacterized protein BJ171DRAFT_90497 [Polychytrium aggregatum]KAI9204840.1 hypothetical protein BJ171DRAFT_90497 [Polychytrium aggregatum]